MKRAIALFGNLATAVLGVTWATTPDAGEQSVRSSPLEFQTSDRCVICHNDMLTTKGESFSIGGDWSVSLMANSSRDPYWLASVRRETMDHAPASAHIENECAACHLPIPDSEAKAGHRETQILAHFSAAGFDNPAGADGVTCSVCHQISAEKLGHPESYNGNFVITSPARSRPPGIWPV